MKKYEVALKIWLPETVKLALIEMCSFADASLSDIIRQTLFTYLYGRYDLMHSIEKGEHDFSFNASVKYSKVSTKSDKVELGKNAFDVKVWIAIKMKNDLQQLADKTGLKLSEFIREILISNLFGLTYLPEHDEMILLRIEFD
ncbi:hypothetical protein [sulfur-oxidizing endosymbiont of Gigantopelta aegis]|uniref:hypothetical protein n=1 Tax=sulfur-oxidizing endosymbiont of Gigantopelta aegis TaxID=2794934 RepID=UPI0018DC339B|nr:hypothetical protein [sulfur-oxidizing endosymbiont of Gigantopelta aegis]